MQETQVCSLGWEDSLEKGMATHSSILAWRIPWTEEPCGLQSMGLQRVSHPSSTNTFTFTFHSLQYHGHCSAAWLLGLSKQKAGSVPGPGHAEAALVGQAESVAAMVWLCAITVSRGEQPLTHTLAPQAASQYLWLCFSPSHLNFCPGFSIPSL